MRVYKLLCVIVLAFFGSVAIAAATVRIHIDLGTQRMHVDSSSGSYSWPVSTARSGYSTPRGSYAPTGMQLMHYSRKYDMSPMPHSIFFRGGYAIHGSYATGSLGRPASHGCVRLSPGNAAHLYQMVQSEGARISISGSPPASRRFASASRHHRRYYAGWQGYEGEGVAYASARQRYYGGGARSWQAQPAFLPFW